MPVQRNVLAAHYEISGGNLTKSLLIFCCAGLITLNSGRLSRLQVGGRTPFRPLSPSFQLSEGLFGRIQRLLQLRVAVSD